MPNDNLLNEAIKFAADAHADQCRKGTRLPYIVHPLEAAAIVAGKSEDKREGVPAEQHPGCHSRVKTTLQRYRIRKG